MADGPLDYDSGYFFESQKGISDRRAERGFPPGPSGTQWSGGSRGGAAGHGGGGLGAFLITAIFFLMIAYIAVGVAVMIGGIWLCFHLVRAIWRSRR